MSDPHVHLIRARYGECDPQGVVFNAHFLSYFDISMTELWRSAFGSYDAMVERGVDIVVAEAQLRFFGAARFDDELSLEVIVQPLGNTNIPTLHRVRRGDELLVEGRMRHVMVSVETRTKTPIPEWMRAGLRPWTAADPGPPAPAADRNPPAPARS